MSCDLALSAVLLLAAVAPNHAADRTGAGRLMTVSTAAVAPAAPAVSHLVAEPMYADIIGRARALKARSEAYRKVSPAVEAALRPLPGFDAFKADVAALSDLDMKGHMDLAARKTDGDLKCILKGISQDLPKKLAELTAAATPAARDAALRDLSYLLNDNVEVITAPPAPPV